MENVESEGQAKSGSKIGIILIVAILLILLGIGGFMLLSKKSTNQTASQVTTQATPIPTPANVFSSIQDALSKSLSLQCDFSDEKGRQTTAFIKNGAVRTNLVSSDPKESSSVIMKDKKVYIWTDKKGIMMEFDPAEVMKNVTPLPSTAVIPSQQNPGDVLEGLEKYKEQCKPTVVADSLFVPPSDVTFTDVSKMLKSVKQSIPSIPSGAMTQDQIKKLQEQYQQ